MNFIILIATLLLITSNVHSQNTCGLELYEKGKTVTLETKVWANTMMFDPAFQKSKGKKREDKIAAFKADIESGKTKPTNSSFSYKVSEVEENENSKKITLVAKVGEQEYTSVSLCQQDSMYFTRNLNPIFSEQDGKVIGIAIQGVQVLPKTLTVGQILSSFTDVATSIPKEENYTVKHQVFAGTRTSSHVERNVHKLNSETSRIEYDDYLVTTTENVYNTIDVAVRKKSKISSHTIHYAWAFVSGEEEIEVLGKKYKAYIIESESWSKSKIDATFETANADVKAAQEKFIADMTKGSEKFGIRTGFLNEAGYITIGIKEWYVPGVGIVKRQAIDAFGIPSSESVISSIK